MNFKNKVVIVTGAGKGIGKVIASMYAEAGAKVVIAEIDHELGSNAEAEIRKNGGEAFFCQTDISIKAQVNSLINRTSHMYGHIDILINNAAVNVVKSPYDLKDEEWDYILDVNLKGSFLCARAAAKSMKEKGGGFIVNISSTRALMSEPNNEAYAASKGGLIALTHSLAISLANDNIKVNAISPGWIETGDYSKLRSRDHFQHPSRRVGKPEDIAKACMYLTDENNDFITGANLVIDGGMTRKMIYLD